MNYRCVIATQNPHKIAEIAPVLDARLEWLTLDQAGWTGGALREDADTFEGNAAMKADQGFKGTDLPTLADDSGLVVPELGGAPGIFSARYAGPNASDEENRLKLMAELNGQERAAYFVCVLAWQSATVRHSVRGEVWGKVLPVERGTGGFGYDALFVPDGGDGRTFAEMKPEEKACISHRAVALNRFKQFSMSDLGL